VGHVGVNGAGADPTFKHGRANSSPVTLGWTDCGHDNYRPGVVLDPFAGTGTTLAVADCHGRDAIGIDIDERNHALYPSRYAEVRKALFGTRPETPGQLDLFGGAA
jgi:DNA modification methylase